MKRSTPFAETESAALSRVLDNVPKGYIHYTKGTIDAARAQDLARKFHEIHAIGASPSQRHTRKKHGKANAILAVYYPPWADTAHWILLFTAGELDSHEVLHDVTRKPYLTWLNYELVRQPFRGKTSWTWRRTKSEMEGLFGLLAEQIHRGDWGSVQKTLEKAAKQPGFHGVREQTWRLCEAAKRNGYDGPIPKLFYMQKQSHGVQVEL